MPEIPERLVEWASDPISPNVVVSDALAADGHDPANANVSAEEENWLLQQHTRGVLWTRDLPLWPRVSCAVEAASAGYTRKAVIGCRDGGVFCSDDTSDELIVVYDSGDHAHTALVGAGTPHALARMNENIFATFLYDGAGHGGAYFSCTHVDGFPTTGADVVLGIFNAHSSLYMNADTIISCSDGVDDLWVFANCEDDSSAETCVQLHDDGSWPLNIVDTARTSPFPAASGTWEVNGAAAYHAGTLVAVRLSDTGISGVVAVSTDSGATWSAESTIVTGVTNWSPRWLAYSSEYAGWICVCSRGHVYLCTGNPASGGNWVKQTLGASSDPPTLLAGELGAAWTCQTAVVVGKTVLLGGYIDGISDTAGVILESDDMFATVRRSLRGYAHVYHGGSRLIYWRPGQLALSPPFASQDFGISYQAR